MSSPTKPTACFPNEPRLPESNISYQVFIQLCDHSARTVKKRQIIITCERNQAVQKNEFVFACGCRVQRVKKMHTSAFMKWMFLCMLSVLHTHIFTSMFVRTRWQNAVLTSYNCPHFADEMHMVPTIHNNTHTHKPPHTQTPSFLPPTQMPLLSVCVFLWPLW